MKKSTKELQKLSKALNEYYSKALSEEIKRGIRAKKESKAKESSNNSV